MTVVGNTNAIGKSVFKFIVVPVASIQVGMASIRVGIVPMAMVLVSRWWMIKTEVGVVAVPPLHSMALDPTHPVSHHLKTLPSYVCRVMAAEGSQGY